MIKCLNERDELFTLWVQTTIIRLPDRDKVVTYFEFLCFRSYFFFVSLTQEGYMLRESCTFKPSVMSDLEMFIRDRVVIVQQLSTLTLNVGSHPVNVYKPLVSWEASSI